MLKSQCPELHTDLTRQKTDDVSRSTRITNRHFGLCVSTPKGSNRPTYTGDTNERYHVVL